MKEKNRAELDETSEPRTRTEKESSPDEHESAPRKPKYEFKILPVDPKNSFDFEDVADK
jgi:hypothetical protein